MQKAHRREKRIVVLTFLVLLAAFVITLANRQNVALALQNAFVFAGVVGLLMVLLHIGASIAERKSYPTWLGVVLTLFLNIIGLMILLVLPDRFSNTDSG